MLVKGPWEVSRAPEAMEWCEKHPEFAPIVNQFLWVVRSRSPFDSSLEYTLVKDVPAEPQPGVVFYPPVHVFRLHDSHGVPLSAALSLLTRKARLLWVAYEP